MCNIEKTILDTIDLNTVSMISFCEAIDIMKCKYMVIKLILEVQINYCF